MPGCLHLPAQVGQQRARWACTPPRQRTLLLAADNRPSSLPPSLPPSALQELDCIEPSITYVKSPANFTSKYHSAPR